jgi:hypothetical protein
MPAAARVPSRPPAMLTTREVLAWVVVLYGAMSLIAVMAKLGVNGLSPASLSAIELIAWGCATMLLLRDPPQPAATPRQALWVVLPLAFAALVPGRIAYFGLFAIAAQVLRGTGWSDNQRRFGVIIVSIALFRVVAKITMVLFADIALRLDTAAAGLMLAWFVPGSTWTGNTLHPPGEVGITVAMACSSFTNLSLVGLCYTSIAVLDGATRSWRNLAAMAGVCLSIIALNTLRLLLMARSLGAYEYWHFGAGAQQFGVGMTVCAVTLSSLGSRWANARR